jgi:hypothetical protein
MKCKNPDCNNEVINTVWNKVFCSDRCCDGFHRNSDKARNYTRQWKEDNKEKIKTQSKEYRDRKKEESSLYSKQYNADTKTKFLELYGHYCHCPGCDITERDFLTIEHVNGQVGKKKETTNGALRRAIDTYPNPEYTVLCWNCNQSTKGGKVCPHSELMLLKK